MSLDNDDRLKTVLRGTGFCSMYISSDSRARQPLRKTGFILAALGAMGGGVHALRTRRQPWIFAGVFGGGTLIFASLFFGEFTRHLLDPLSAFLIEIC